MKPEHEAMALRWSLDRNLLQNTTAEKIVLKLSEEVGEIAKAILEGDLQGAKDGIGDCQVVMANLCAKLGTTMDECFLEAWGDIKDRKGTVRNGTFVKEKD